MVAVSMLANVSLFASLDLGELEHIAQTSHRLGYERYEVIIREGDRDDRLFVILEGTAELFKWYGEKRQRHLIDLEAGAYFGELALLNNHRRSATVKAKTKMEVLCLPKVDLFDVLRKRPEVGIALLQTLGRKLLNLETLLGGTLGGFVSICASCKNVRDDDKSWKTIEEYISSHSDVHFSHSLCPNCDRLLNPEFYA